MAGHVLNWSPLKSVEIGGQRITTASRAELAAAWVADCRSARDGMRNGPPRVIFDANGHGISLARTDHDYSSYVKEADVIHADGGFLVLLSLFLGEPIKERSATTDMFHDFAVEAVRNDLTFYLLGATEVVNRRCSEIMTERYPKLRIVGRRNGYFGPEDETAIVDAINEANPDVIWIGLGKPKEQAFAIKWKSKLNARWAITCGGCYNYVTGHYRRAPEWMQAFHLEWLHRAASDPRRLFARYATTSPHALWVVAEYYLKRRNSRNTGWF